MLFIFIIIDAPNAFGIFAKDIEKDARKSQKIGDWEVSKSINDKMCAMIFYDDINKKYTVSIYVNRDGFSFGYFFRYGGAISYGVNEFSCDYKNIALISMNEDRVARIEQDNGIDIIKIDIDPNKPFATVLPDDFGLITLYNDDGNVIPIIRKIEM